MVTNLIKVTLVLFSLSLQAAMPPVTLSSPDNNFKKGATSLFVPKSQATYLGGIKSRIETGNENQLINPSFESVEADDFGWTASGATISTSTPSVDGRALQLSLSGLLDINQEIGAGAAAFEGVQMLASVYVKTTLQDVYVCALTNAVESGCTKATGSGKFEQIIIPFIGNATSNGIIIKTTSSTSGTVYIDSAFVGTSSPLQNVTGESSVSAKISDTGVVSNESLDFINGNCSVSGTSVYTCTFATNYFKSTPNCFVTLDNGTVNPFGSSMNGASTTTTTMIYATFNSSTGAANARPVMVLCQKTGLDLPGSSKTYSQASQDYDWTLFTPTSPNSSWASLSSTECYHKREGSDLLVQCKFIGNTPAATEARISLPAGLTSADTTKIPSIRKVGAATFSSVAGGNTHVLIEPSVSYFTFGYETASAGGLTKSTASNMASSGASTSLEARIPIQGWQDYGVIVGSFAGIEKCANDYECTDMFSATITNGNAISNQNLPWLSTANWSPAGTLTLTFNTNLKDGTSALSSNMNCWAIPSTQGQRMSVNTVSTTQVIFENRANDGTSNSTPTLAYVYCQKGSHDYKPKTAKVASSIGVPTVPGITTSGTGNLIDTFSVSYGATSGTVCSTASTNCAYNDTIGTTGNYVYRGASAGGYTLFLNKTYAKIKCSGSCNSTNSCSITNMNGSSVSSLTFSTIIASGSGADSYGTLLCQGSY